MPKAVCELARQLTHVFLKNTGKRVTFADDPTDEIAPLTRGTRFW